MICKKCGRELPENAKFCGVCGSPTFNLTDYTAPGQPTENADASKRAPQPEPKAEPQTKSAPPPSYQQKSAGGYAPNGYTASFLPEQKEPLTTGAFLCMDLLMLVPILNVVLLILWGFGGDANINRRNWARSRLVWIGIGLGIMILLLIIGLLTV